MKDQTSAAVHKAAKQEGSRTDLIFSRICLVILLVYMVLLMFPGFFSDHTIETETYVLMAVWALLGLFFFNRVIRKDHARNFGKAIIVWVALLAFIVTKAMTLAERMNEFRENIVVDEIYGYFDGTADESTLALDEHTFLEAQRQRLHDADNASVLVIAGLFGLSLAVLMVNYSSMKKWEKKTADERDQARVAAFTDPLTGVKSKHAFVVQEGTMEERIADGEAAAFAVVVCDVNGLKQINDTLGHKAGDEYIRAACDMLCAHYAHSPVFRIGGDEFVVLLEGQDYASRHALLETINARIEENLAAGGVVASLGMAEYAYGKDKSFHEVFKRADALMYDRKMQLKGMGAVTRD